MSAADKREELEAAIWLAPGGGKHLSRRSVEDILAKADDYATAVASDALDGVVRAARARDRRDALAEAVRNGT